MKKILLVEDDPFIIDIYKTSLERANFKVKIAKEGSSALKKIKEDKPDLILLDIVLPDVDGWEVLKKLKDDPNLKNLKIFVFSNLGQKGEVEKGLKLGATKYFIKAHYTPSQIVKEIKKELHG